MRLDRRPPEGYVIVDEEAWVASSTMLSDDDIRELASGGLARCGLAVAPVAEEVDW